MELKPLRIGLLCIFALIVSNLVVAQDNKPNERIAIDLKGLLKEESPSKIKVRDLVRLPMVEYSADNPFSKKRLKYRGVPLKTLVSHYAKEETKQIVMIAIDDYTAIFDRKDWEAWDVMLAIQANDRYFSVADGGPALVVFPYDDIPESSKVRYTSKWIWQVISIEFR